VQNDINWAAECLKFASTALGGLAGALIGVLAKRRSLIDQIDVRADKLETILDEVKAVQAIQIKMAGDEWSRQTVWREKRDMYAKLIAAADAIMSKPFRYSDGAPQEEDKALWADLSLADSYARLFGSDDCIKTLNKYWDSRKLAFETSPKDQAEEALQFIFKLIDTAKEDLGVHRLG
jgi:hypothetical protein